MGRQPVGEILGECAQESVQEPRTQSLRSTRCATHDVAPRRQNSVSLTELELRFHDGATE